MLRGVLALVTVAAVVALAAGIFSAGSVSSKGPADETLPMRESNGTNVLLIVTDDQRLETMEVMPETREFFKRGTSYRRAFTITPQCCPSRATLLSGQYIHNNGVESNGEALDLDADQTWPRLLDEAGYRTGFFGKYLNAWDPEDAPPNFDESFVGFDPDHSESAENSSAFVTARAKRFIRGANEDKQPWAVQLSLRAPHAPRIYPKRYEDAHIPRWHRSPANRERNFADKNPALEGAQEDHYPHAEVRAGQLKMLTAADDALAHLYRLLESEGDLGDTLVIFVSDNGYYWGEHRLSGKGLPYLDSLRVPMLARGPGVSTGQSDEIVANIDVAPTILDATGVEPDYTLDGSSLLAKGKRDWLLLEGSRDLINDDFPLWRHGYVSKSTHYFEWDDSSEELYDLRSDPYELKNVLAGGHAAPGLAKIRSQVDAAIACAGTDCP